MRDRSRSEFYSKYLISTYILTKLTQYFLQRARKLAQIVVLKLPQYYFLAACQKTCTYTDRLRLPTQTPITRPLHHHTSSSEASHLDGLSSPDACPLSSPPTPSRHVLGVSLVGRRGQQHCRIHRRRAGGGGRSHPSSSSSLATTTLCAARPPPLDAPSNICSCSRQRDNITSPSIVTASR